MKSEATKDRILLAALDLFSRCGYEAVSVEQIASAVGIKAPSLYKHYKGKRDIFGAIFAEMDKRYNEHAASMQMHLSGAESDLQMFSKITEDDLVLKVRELVQYSLRDEYVSKFRRMLTIEQFRVRDFAELYTRRYLDSMMNYHERLFTELVKAGILKDVDAHVMALQYVSPVCVLLSLCDREPQREDEAMALLERHIRQFNRIYRKRER